MDSTFSFRPATLDDLPRIMEIERKVHAFPWSMEHFQTELTKPYSHFLIITDDETDTVVVAYIVCWAMFDECQILNIAVDFPYRGLGFAKQMIRKVISITQNQGIKKIVLDVRKSNMAAIQLYQGIGFVINHIRKKFYSNEEDAYQMVLQFDQEGMEF
jgi:[ribosomal protein S18]-alanine N-acetyltransferase